MVVNEAAGGSRTQFSRLCPGKKIDTPAARLVRFCRSCLSCQQDGLSREQLIIGGVQILPLVFESYHSLLTLNLITRSSAAPPDSQSHMHYSERLHDYSLNYELNNKSLLCSLRLLHHQE